MSLAQQIASPSPVPTSVISDPLFQLVVGIIIGPIILAWVIWCAEHRPKQSPTLQEIYIDDASIRKVQVFSIFFDWGTRFYPFKHLKISEVALSASVLVRFTPNEGLEKDLTTEYWESNIKKNCKEVRLCQKSHFKKDAISCVRLYVYTPFVKEKYTDFIKQEVKDDVLRVWNGNSEEIRNFRLMLTRPIILSGLEVLKGTIVSVTLEIPYPLLNKVTKKEIGSINNDAAMSLLVNLPPKSLSGEEQLVVKLAS